MTQSPQSSATTFTKALDAIAHERVLQAQGVSFRTDIVKTKKRGLEYRVTRLERQDVGTV